MIVVELEIIHTVLWFDPDSTKNAFRFFVFSNTFLQLRKFFHDLVNFSSLLQKFCREIYTKNGIFDSLFQNFTNFSSPETFYLQKFLHIN